MEARAGIEPANRGFADPGLTTWLPRLLHWESGEDGKGWVWVQLKNFLGSEEEMEVFLDRLEVGVGGFFEEEEIEEGSEGEHGAEGDVDA